MTALFYLGLIVAAGCWLWLVIIALQTSAPWALLVLIFPPVGGFIFAVMHWADAKKPVLIQLGGILMVIVAMKSNPALKLPWSPWG